MKLPLFVANWKMNVRRAEVPAYFSKLKSLLPSVANGSVWFAPPLTSLDVVREELSQLPFKAELGIQNCHWLETGAHTGEVSAAMASEAGATFVILGHSERRQFYGETDGGVAKRALAALNAGLAAIVCVGESRETYESGRTEQFVGAQLEASLAGIPANLLSRLVVAYEPIWAIGTGIAASPADASKVHQMIVSRLGALYPGSETPILYGGSTTPDNIESYLAVPQVSGVLVGGASIKPDVWATLIQRGEAVKR